MSLLLKLSRPLQVVFEAEHGRGDQGEIGLDNVVLTSGSCPEEEAALF